MIVLIPPAVCYVVIAHHRKEKGIRLGWLQWHNLHSTFYENLSISLEVEHWDMHRQHGDLISLLFFFPFKKGKYTKRIRMHPTQLHQCRKSVIQLKTIISCLNQVVLMSS
jgi:hypothetical protein